MTTWLVLWEHRAILQVYGHAVRTVSCSRVVEEENEDAAFEAVAPGVPRGEVTCLRLQETMHDEVS